MSFSEWRDDGVVICLERGADLHMAPLMPLPLIVPDKGLLNGYVMSDTGASW